MKLAPQSSRPACITVIPDATATAAVAAALGEGYVALRRTTTMLLEIRGVDTGFTWGIGRTADEAIRDARAARALVA